MDIYSYFIFAFGICSFFAGILVLSKRGDFLGRFFFIYSFLLASWGIGASIMLNNKADYQIALWAIRYADGAAAFIPVAWIHLASILTQTYSLAWKRTIRFLYCFCILFFPFAFSPWFIPKLAPIMEYGHFTTTGPLFTPLTLLYFILVPLGFFKLIRYLSAPKQNPLNRPAIIGFTFFSFIGYSAGALAFPPAYGIPAPQELFFLMPIYPLGLGYCIMRYGLFTMEDFAQAAHREKLALMGTLMASINHEIRSPLFMLRGMLDRQREAKDLKDLESQIVTMQNQITRIESIIKRFNQFAKAEVSSPPQIQPMTLSEAIANAIEIAQHEINYRMVQIQKEIRADLPKVMAEKHSLEQALFNLIINACQALKETASPVLSFTASHNESMVSLFIQDNGPGIVPEVQSILFKPFYTTKNEGTGLGLFITKRLVESMHGKIQATSSKLGTTFTLTLPAAL